MEPADATTTANERLTPQSDAAVSERPALPTYVRTVDGARRWLVSGSRRFENVVLKLKTSSLMQLIQLASSFSVPVAVIVYLLGNGDRARERLYHSAEIISRPPGTIADAARGAALEDLAAHGIPLDGVRLPDSLVMWILDLRGARMSHSTLRNESLIQSNLACRHSALVARLRRIRQTRNCFVAEFSDWSGSDLGGSNLRSADLWFSYFEGVALDATNLTDATLYETNLVGATLRRANLSHADIEGANFTAANITEADLSGVTNWRKSTWRYANIYHVRNPPIGFERWALDSAGAVALAPREWSAFSKDSNTRAAADSAYAYWCRIRPSVPCGPRGRPGYKLH